MKISFADYLDKVKACWLGKNVGGTLGAPFECFRGVYDLEYYTHDLKMGVLPNDDLDLQLVWLNAAERYGKNVNAEILGEYWLSYIVADWSEYGAGKANLANALQPPMSGWYNNHNKDSCGCFIRSEIWACLAPGRPDIAVKYAYEDACCDHAHEGLYGELFCAAVESAAFAEKDMQKLVEIGLSYIPEDCDVAKAVRAALKCYDEGMDWKQARKYILNLVPGGFGMMNGYKDTESETDVAVGPVGYDAPSNIGLMMVGWVFGEGDFSKSICIAAGCCEDADCTAGTLGSILGIINGTKFIDEKWLLPIGDEIKTISIDRTKHPELAIKIPDTVTELTERVVKLMPVFMQGYYTFNLNGEIEILIDDEMNNEYTRVGTYDYIKTHELYSGSPVCVRASNALFDVKILYKDENINVAKDVVKNFEIVITNNIHSQQWLEFNLYLPEEWQALPGKSFLVCLDQYHGGTTITKKEFSILPAVIDKSRYDIIIEIISNGRLTKTYIPLILLT